MKLKVRVQVVCTAAAVAAAVVFSAGVQASSALRVTSGEVAVLCPLTVGGSFEAKTDAVRGELATAGEGQPLLGDLTVDLQTLRTGIGLRDRHMKDNYLEVQRGAEFSAARLQQIRVAALEGKTTFRGQLTLHGQQKEVTGTATIKPNGQGYRVEATFPVKLDEFAIPDPTYLGVGVKDEVQVRVNFSVAPAATARR
jgi:polyisoprenoid-binding protein YceI